jgi:hypothetical protein
MSGTDTAVDSHEKISSEQLDLSTVVGHDVTIYSRQFPGKPLQSKVVLVSQNILSLDRSGSGGQIDSLVNNQRITIKLDYKGQPVALAAVLKRSSGGRCNILLGDHVTLLARRRFARIPVDRPAKFAVIPTSGVSRPQANRLRWLDSTTTDFSGGGVLVQLTSSLELMSYILLNIDMEDLPLPSLIVGQVRYTYTTESGKIATGIEFIVREDRDKHASAGLTDSLPPVVFEYTAALRDSIDGQIKAWKQTNVKNHYARSTRS